MLIEGSISVKAVLLTGSRDITEIIIDREKRSGDITYIMKEAAKRGVSVTLLQSADFTLHVKGRTHGGVAAEVGERKYEPLCELLSVENPFIALLEGVEDPYNFGDALRSLYAAGVTGLIIPERNWMSAADTVVRASAGASEHIPTAACADLSEALHEAKKRGIKILCAERRDAVSLYDADLREPLLLAIGGELRGLSRQVTDNSDGNIFIPYGSTFRNALSASAAAAVCAFEVMRRRKDIG